MSIREALLVYRLLVLVLQRPALALIRDDDRDDLGVRRHQLHLGDRVDVGVLLEPEGCDVAVFAEQGDLPGEPCGYGLLRVAAEVVRHHDGGEVGMLGEQRAFAFTGGAGQLVGEQVVSGHPVQDVVHAVDVAGRHEASGGDGQDVA